MFHFLLFFVILPAIGVTVLVCLLPGTGVVFRDLLGLAASVPRRIRSAWWSWRARDDRDIVNSPVLPPRAAAPAKADPAPQPRRPAAAPAPARRVPPPPPPPGKPGKPRAAGGKVLDGVIVPAAWAALAESIGGFEPENHVEHLNFFSGTIAGILAVAEAFRANAEMQFNHLGLDPAAANATLEFADIFADSAEAAGLSRQQFLVIYQEVLNAIENGLVLPHSGRWLTGEAA